ncbi:MAG: hypothetical protein IPJ93_13455 [Bacteroidota bacterium]|nr:MAG: hypothetical protein IPJ93_13455 [Bacteroidota bacterium]
MKEKDYSKKMNLLDKSIEQLEKGVAILPTYSEAYYHLGLAYKERENYAKVLRALSMQLRVKHLPTRSFLFHGVLHVEKQNVIRRVLKL